MSFAGDQFRPRASTTTTPAGNGIFLSLEREWRRVSTTTENMARVRGWADAEPALAGCVDARAVVRRVVWDGRHASAPGDEVLSALLRLAADPFAARTLLQALCPRIRAERVLTPRYGHGVGEAWQKPADLVADLLAEAFAAVKRHAGEHRDDVARVILQEATRRLRTARQAQRRYQERTVLLGPAHAIHIAAGLSGARSSAEWLATALTDAVRARRLSKAQASLVYAARVQGLPASDVGRRAGMAPKAVYYALAQAERALLLTPA